MALRDWLILTLTPGLGPIRLRRLLDAVGSAEEALRATPALLSKLDGFGPKLAADVAAGLRNAPRAADRELAKADALGINLVCLDDAAYPPLLREIPDPPPVLWLWGSLQPRDLNALAIVGSRRPSGYGKEQAERFGTLLAGAGFTVVSGGAYGIDTAAHRGALRATDGRTVAVLGSGVDVPYPPENRPLFDQIIEAGVVLSEHPLGTQPRRENFPRRNRIISGLSRGVLVVEADITSGALITARQAADDHGRPVFALPGRVDNPLSAGPHDLLRQGAILTAGLEDITGNLGPLPMHVYEPLAPSSAEPDNLFNAPPTPPAPTAAVAVPPAEVAALSEVDRILLGALDGSALSADGLIDRTDLPAAQVQAGLMMLGIKGFIKRRPDGLFERVR